MPLLCVPGIVAAFLLGHTVSYNCLYFSPVVNPLSKFIYLIEGQKRKVAYGWGGSYLLVHSSDTHSRRKSGGQSRFYTW